METATVIVPLRITQEDSCPAEAHTLLTTSRLVHMFYLSRNRILRAAIPMRCRERLRRFAGRCCRVRRLSSATTPSVSASRLAGPVGPRDGDCRGRFGRLRLRPEHLHPLVCRALHRRKTARPGAEKPLYRHHRARADRSRRDALYHLRARHRPPRARTRAGKATSTRSVAANSPPWAAPSSTASTTGDRARLRDQELADTLAHTDGIRSSHGDRQRGRIFLRFAPRGARERLRLRPRPRRQPLRGLAFNRGETGSESGAHPPAAYAALQLTCRSRSVPTTSQLHRRRRRAPSPDVEAELARQREALARTSPTCSASRCRRRTTSSRRP